MTMVNPTRGWDRVPVFGWWSVAPGVPAAGQIEFVVPDRIRRVDGRMIYPGGVTRRVTIGKSEDQDPVIREQVRQAMRAVAEAEHGAEFDGAAWDERWQTNLAAAVFTSFWASDDPDITPKDWQVMVRERLTSAAGKEYPIQPLIGHLALPVPGINLGMIEVPPGAPSAPLPVYAKGQPGGVAALNLEGNVVNSRGEEVTGGEVSDEDLAALVDDEESAFRTSLAGTIATATEGAVTTLVLGEDGKIKPDLLPGGGGGTIVETYVEDTFTRADATTLGTPEVGVNPWVSSAVGDQLGILNGKAYQPGTANSLHSTVDTGHADGILSVTLTAGNTLGAMLRFIDSSNYLRVMMASTALIIEKRDGGAFSTLASTPWTATTGTDYALTVTLDGPAITVAVDNEDVLAHTLSGGDQTKFGEATKFGPTQSSRNPAHRWDDFRFTSLPMAAPDPEIESSLRAWAAAGAYTVTGGIVRDAYGNATSATVVWPDGSGGTYTATDTAGGNVNAYTITHTTSSRRVRQPAVTRNAQGEVTAAPALTVETI